MSDIVLVRQILGSAAILRAMHNEPVVVLYHPETAEEFDEHYRAGLEAEGMRIMEADWIEPGIMVVSESDIHL
jgi:hypothetical protein